MTNNDFSICPVCASSNVRVQDGFQTAEVQDYGSQLEATQERYCRHCGARWDVEFKAVDVTITRQPDLDHAEKLTALQNEFVNVMIASDQQDEARKRLANGDVFYADVVHCLNGNFSVGSSQAYGSDQCVPLLYMTEGEAMEVNREAREEIDADIRDGHRDEDDRYEGQVMAVRWVADTLYFCDLGIYESLLDSGSSKHEARDLAYLGDTSVNRAMGL